MPFPRYTTDSESTHGVKGILVTATDEVVVWWAGCAGSKSSKCAKLCPLIIRKDGSDKKWKRALPKPYDRKVKKLPKDFFMLSRRPLQIYKLSMRMGATLFSGKPYRYDTGHTTHIWWTIR